MNADRNTVLIRELPQPRYYLGKLVDYLLVGKGSKIEKDMSYDQLTHEI